MAEFYLDVLDGAGRAVEEIAVAGPATIGRPSRDFTPDVKIPQQCLSASRQHASIKLQGGQLVLEDQSRFGTIVNHTRIEHSSVALHHGVEIIFGLPEDGWRVRFRTPIDPGGTTAPADLLDLLAVSEVAGRSGSGLRGSAEYSRRSLAL